MSVAGPAGVAASVRARPRTSGLLGGTPTWVVVGMLTGALMVAVVVSIGLGPVTVPPEVVVDVLATHLTGNAPSAVDPTDVIVWQLRAPRVVQGAFVGAGLAVAGLLVQAMVRNPLGDPYVLGLSSGAAVGAVLVITAVGSTAAGLLTVPAAAFVGALLSAAVVLAFARAHGRLQPSRMIMAGVTIGQLLGGVVSFLLLRTRDVDAQQQVLFWLLGSLAGARWDLALTCAAAVTTIVTLAAAGAGRLNLLVLGDDAAAALGADAGRIRAVLFVAVGLLTGTVVAVSGSIGFVGLIVPNLARLLLGANHRRVLSASALLGALLVVWSDTAARLILAPTELPIGILTAAIGVPAFLVVLRRSPADSVGLS